MSTGTVQPCRASKSCPAHFAMFPPATPSKPPAFRRLAWNAATWGEVGQGAGVAGAGYGHTVQRTETGSWRNGRVWSSKTWGQMEDAEEKEQEEQGSDAYGERNCKWSHWTENETREDEDPDYDDRGWTGVGNSHEWAWSDHWINDSMHENTTQEFPKEPPEKAHKEHHRSDDTWCWEGKAATRWSSWQEADTQGAGTSGRHQWHNWDQPQGDERHEGSHKSKWRADQSWKHRESGASWQEASKVYSSEGYELIYLSKVEAKLMLTMPGFTSFHVNRVIGKKGSVLRDLSRTTGTEVILKGHDSNRPTDEPNHLLIKARSSADLDRGLQKACETVAGVLQNEFSICTRCGGDHKSRDCFKSRLPFVRPVYLDPCANVGFIIGAQGRNIQPIKDGTGANIRILGVGSGEKNATEPLHMRIEAASQDLLDQAVAMAQDLLRRVTSWSPYDKDPPAGHVFAYQHKIWLDMEADRQGYDSLNAHLLGKSGQHFRQIHERTGAWLWLRGHGAGHTSCLDQGAKEEGLHLVIEHDDREKSQEAIQLAMNLLDTVLARLGSTYCNICGGPHFTYRCAKVSSAGYLNEMAAKGDKGSGKSRAHLPAKRGISDV